jgi:hypothetical protein
MADSTDVKPTARDVDAPVVVSNVSGPGYNPDVANPGELPEGVEPTADVVAMVSRDVNGDPMQSVNFRVMVDPDAPDDVKAAHYNLAGKAAGARYVKTDGGGDAAEVKDSSSKPPVKATGARA